MPTSCLKKEVKLKSIEIENFRSFVSRQTITFPQSGICLIQGKNLDTGGSSRAGKSNIVNAIAYLLGYAPFSAKYCPTLESKTPMHLSGQWELDQSLTINRSKGLSIEYGQKWTSKEAEQALDQILGCNADIRKVLCYRDQNEVGNFLTKKPAEKKELLTKLLGLDHIEAEIEKYENLVRTLDIDGTQKLVSITESQVRQNQANFEWFKDNETPPVIPPAFKVTVSQTEKPAQKPNPFESKQRDLQKETQNLLSKKIKLGNEIDYHHAEIKRIENENKKLADAYCFTCGQMWDKAEGALSQNWANQKDALAFIDDRQRDLADLNIEIDDLNEEIRVNAQKIKDFQNEYLTELQKWNEDNQEYNIQIAKQKQSVIDIAQARKATELYKTKYNQFENQLHNTQTELNKYITKLNDLQSKWNLWQDYTQALKLFLNKIFAEILQDFTNKINYLLLQIPNTQDIRIELLPEKETKTGSFKPQIQTKVFFNGTETDLTSIASGGTVSSIQLAADLALIDLVENRTGVRFGWLVLDEVFKGHDKVVEENCLELLKVQAQDKLIIVISHSTELQQIYDHVITVTSQNGVSVVNV